MGVGGWVTTVQTAGASQNSDMGNASVARCGVSAVVVVVGTAAKAVVGVVKASSAARFLVRLTMTTSLTSEQSSKSIIRSPMPATCPSKQ